MLCDALAALTKCSDETRPHDAAEVSSIGAQKVTGRVCGGGGANGNWRVPGQSQGLPTRRSLHEGGCFARVKIACVSGLLVVCVLPKPPINFRLQGAWGLDLVACMHLHIKHCAEPDPILRTESP